MTTPLIALVLPSWSTVVRPAHPILSTSHPPDITQRFGTSWRISTRSTVLSVGAQAPQGRAVIGSIRAAVLLVLLLVLPSSVAGAQHSLHIPAVLERAIAETEPAWDLVSLTVRKTAEENWTFFRWKRDDQDVDVRVNEYQERVEDFSPLSFMTAAPRERTRVEGIGDEAYLLSSSRSDRPPGFDLVFRKGRVLVSVEAGSAEIARRFAALLSETLPQHDK